MNLLLAANSSVNASADRTLTFDVKNANRTLSLLGNLTLGGSLTTSGAYGTTLTATGTTSVDATNIWYSYIKRW